MYIITGVGRSGTSFIAEILHNCGISMGKYNPSIDAGFELESITAINKTMMDGDYWGDASIINRMKTLAAQTRVAKDPRFMMTLGVWITAGVLFDGVYICTRNYTDIIESSEKTNAGLMSMFNGWDVNMKKGIMFNLEAGIKFLCYQIGRASCRERV